MAKKKKTKKKRSFNKRSLIKEVIKVFRLSPKKTFNYRQISKEIGIKDNSVKQLVLNVLHELHEQDRLILIDKGKYRYKKTTIALEGVVDITTKGHAYVSVEGMEQDVFVRNKYLQNSVSGDRVRLALFSTFKKRKPEGEIIEIIERNKIQFVGIVELSEKAAFVLINNPRIHFDVFLTNKERQKVKNGQQIVVQIVDWGNNTTNPTGKVIEVLGYPGEHAVEIHSILAEYEFPHQFDKVVEYAAKNISTEITKEEIAKRKDFRRVCTFTIDPYDAKDFDDALSVQKLKNGNWEVGVHIADVSHYIQTDDIIDVEAQRRATSVYLVDRVVPMLPEVLSNNLCSLRPNEEKLCFSAVFELNEKAEIKKNWFGRTVILSNHRFTYEGAQKVIEEEKGKLASELLLLNKLAEQMRLRRMQAGAISFERLETKFYLDEEKNPTKIYFKESKAAHKLIEEFMLLANRQVADFIGNQSLPFVYRVHDEPDPEKLQNFTEFIKKFGYNLQTSNSKKIATSINQVLKDINGKEEANMIETLAIRTMAKASYTTENIGHYGLAFLHYSHFTSPIRRYPDIIVHRLLQHYLNKGKAVDKDEIEKLCKHASQQEIKATKAERDSIKYMQAKYMSEKVGMTFEGIISGVTDFGMFVEITSTGCEGLIKIRDIPDDFYFFDEDNYCLEGTNTAKIYQLGNKVKVKIRKVDISKKEIDLSLILK
tara:strand:+ start:329 stop:2458 length:2130 start_codon:yes stop_codon:yes gene_type:complete